MQQARQVLLQVGTIILCVNGGLWFVSNLRDDGPPTFGQLVFRIGVFLLGLFLVGSAGVLALIQKFVTPAEDQSKPAGGENDESDLIVGESSEPREEIE